MNERLRQAARTALKEMCNTVAPRDSYTNAVDDLDAALTESDEFKPATIHTLRAPSENWDSIFAGDQRALIVPDAGQYETGHWFDLKRQHAGIEVPMFACDGVEQRLLVKVTHIVRSEFIKITVPGGDPIPALVLSIKRI